MNGLSYFLQIHLGKQGENITKEIFFCPLLYFILCMYAYMLKKKYKRQDLTEAKVMII